MCAYIFVSSCDTPYLLHSPIYIFKSVSYLITLIRKMASGVAKLDVEVELKSSAVKMWGCIRESASLLPKVLPDVYKSVDILEGDGKAVGSVRLVKFAPGFPMMTESTEKIDVVDEANKMAAYHVIDGDLLKHYKNFKAMLIVVPKGEGCLVKWGCEFDKTSDIVVNTDGLKEFAIRDFKALDDYLIKA